MDMTHDDRFASRLPAFADGMHGWCLETYDGQRCRCDQVETVAYAPADHDFGGCLEVTNTGDTQFLYTECPQALEASERIGIKFILKAVSGPLPTICIAARPAGQHCDAMLRSNPIRLDRHQKVAALFAVIGLEAGSALPAKRDIGLCVTGAVGGTLRVADAEVFDIALAV